MEPKKTGMTLEEIKRAIKFKKYEISRPYEWFEGHGIRATFEISSTIEIDKQTVYYIPNFPKYLEEIKEHLRKEIISTLFESRRKELIDAIREFVAADRYEFREYNAAREKLCRVAGVQPDKTITDYFTEQERKETYEISCSR